MKSGSLPPQSQKLKQFLLHFSSVWNNFSSVRNKASLSGSLVARCPGFKKNLSGEGFMEVLSTTVDRGQESKSLKCFLPKMFLNILSNIEGLLSKCSSKSSNGKQQYKLLMQTLFSLVVWGSFKKSY